MPAQAIERLRNVFTHIVWFSVPAHCRSVPGKRRNRTSSGTCKELTHVYRRTTVTRPVSLNKKSFSPWFFRCQNSKSVHSTRCLIGRPARPDDLSFADNFKLPS